MLAWLASVILNLRMLHLYDTSEAQAMTKENFDSHKKSYIGFSCAATEIGQSYENSRGDQKWLSRFLQVGLLIKVIAEGR